MKDEIQKEIEKLIRENAGPNVISVEIRVSDGRFDVIEYSRSFSTDAQWNGTRNLRGVVI